MTSILNDKYRWQDSKPCRSFFSIITRLLLNRVIPLYNFFHVQNHFQWTKTNLIFGNVLKRRLWFWLVMYLSSNHFLIGRRWRVSDNLKSVQIILRRQHYGYMVWWRWYLCRALRQRRCYRLVIIFNILLQEILKVKYTLIYLGAY